MRFDHLLPEAIFESVAVQGFRPTGVLVPLNSYESRVYEIGWEDHEPIISKYYRPGRWSEETIADEHRFLLALEEAEVPAVPPLKLSRHLPAVETLAQADSIYYALYPRFRGKAHDETSDEDRRWLGRTLARLHNIGQTFHAAHRLTLNPQTYGYASLEFILGQPFLPADLKKNLETSLLQALKRIGPFFEKVENFPVHGDCHPGNILWNKNGPHLVDFDDMVIAPPAQDLWMLFYGNEEERKRQREAFFEGYETFRRFDPTTLILTEPLRTLRMIRHAAWIGQRYEEPIFRHAFPYYEERRYWEEFLLEIKEQISLLQDL